MSGAVERNSDKKRLREQHSSAPSPTMRLKVKGQDGVDVFFTIKRDTMLRKLLVTYCKKLNLEYKTMEFLYNGERILEGQSPDDSLDAKAFVFLFDGHRIKAEQTPEQPGMEDVDEIYAMPHQTGGGGGGGFGDI